MAVYTTLSLEEIASFLSQYDVGVLVSVKGIAEGIENSNYLLRTQKNGDEQRYILTIYEQRVKPEELPYFLGLTEFLAGRGIMCPRPIRGNDGEAIYHIKGKSAALIEFLEGRGNPHITSAHTALVGDVTARMHQAVAGFPLSRHNDLSLEGWQRLFDRSAARADEVMPGLSQLISQEMDYLRSHWPDHLPRGVIHADLFPDNVFFIDDYTDQPVLSGVIDFYFACNDYFIYDLLIAMNAWCFSSAHLFLPERAQAMLAAYTNVRLLTPEEKKAMPVLARGAAMRFLATRLYDWLHPAPGALVNPKDPMEYVAKLRFHQQITDWHEYGWRV